jgi:hypothetical protein
MKNMQGHIIFTIASLTLVIATHAQSGVTINGLQVTKAMSPHRSNFSTPDEATSTSKMSTPPLDPPADWSTSQQ